MADALTSLLVIFALLAGKFTGWQVLDPLMEILGAILVARWSVSLLRATSRVLLDVQAPAFSLPSPSFYVFFVTFPTFPAGIPDLFNIPCDFAVICEHLGFSNGV